MPCYPHVHSPAVLVKHPFPQDVQDVAGDVPSLRRPEAAGDLGVPWRTGCFARHARPCAVMFQLASEAIPAVCPAPFCGAAGAGAL